jgi:hypothetical protein
VFCVWLVVQRIARYFTVKNITVYCYFLCVHYIPSVRTDTAIIVISTLVQDAGRVHTDGFCSVDYQCCRTDGAEGPDDPQSPERTVFYWTGF